MKLMLPYPSFQEKVKEERNAMDETEKRTALKEFQGIPGVGKTISLDLWNMGFRAVQDLQNQDPEELYARLCIQQGAQVDRCMLYVFRCAVYYATNEVHDAELLKWWNWKDRSTSTEGATQ